MAGICNFGIIPAVGARFLVYFLGLPPYIDLFSLHVVSYIPLMAGLLTLTLLLATSGGLITIMVINCSEGILSQLFYLAIIAGLLMMFRWEQIATILVDRPSGKSLVDPFDIGGAADFNVWYVLMGIFVSVYGTMAWQNASAYNSAALTPHESRMGGLLGRWREMGKVVVVTLLAVCAMTYLQHPDFSAQSRGAQEAIERIHDGSTQRQMRLPIAVAYMLPVGIKGLLCAILIMGVFGGCLWHLVAPWPVSAWISYWHVTGVLVPIVISLVTGIWFTWGGLHDMRTLFCRLREEKVNCLDDGTVYWHQNLGEAEPAAKPVDASVL